MFNKKKSMLEIELVLGEFQNYVEIEGF